MEVVGIERLEVDGVAAAFADFAERQFPKAPDFLKEVGDVLRGTGIDRELALVADELVGGEVGDFVRETLHVAGVGDGFAAGAEPAGTESRGADRAAVA